MNSRDLLLAADVGGTKTLLQLLRRDPQAPHGTVALAEQRYLSQAFDSLTIMVQRFLDEAGLGLPHSACFAVAGPVKQQQDRQTAQLTNLPWQLDSLEMSATLAIPHVHLLNDFQAIGYSLDALGSDELVALQTRPIEPQAPRLVVGAGTGLGVCLVVDDGGQARSHATEGGHIAFAPLDIQQDSLNLFLRTRFSRVSAERLLSGSGLVQIYRFLLQQQQRSEDALLQQDDPAAAIGTQALSGHPLAREAVNLFLRIYGATVGDLALASLPRGGVYIAGGIAPKLLPLMQNGIFMQAFTDKGRMRRLLDELPVQVITNPACGLLGAARYAARF
jgi:glucokinase